jgi:hypothetical protein
MMCREMKSVLFSLNSMHFKRKMQYETYQATSGVDTSQIHFQINPPFGGCTLKGKSLIMKLPLTIVLKKIDGNNWAGASTPFAKHAYGLAQFPFARVMEDMTVLVNGNHEFKYAPSVFHHALKTYTKLDDPKIQQEFAMPDLFSRFNGYTGSTTYNSNHPLAAHGTTTGFMSRASHFTESPMYIDDNGAKSSTPTPRVAIEFVVTMPIPMEIFKKDIHNITSINIMCRMMSKENLIYLYNTAGTNNTELAGALFDFQFKTLRFPSPMCTALWEIPSDRVYYPVQRYRNKRYEFITLPDTKMNTFSDVDHSVTSNLFTFGKATKMYVYSQLNPYNIPNNVATYDKTYMSCVFGVIRKFALMLNNQTYFAHYDENMIWEMCERNGFFHSFMNAHGGSFYANGFTTGAGTVVCVDLQKDVKGEDVNTARVSVEYDYALQVPSYNNVYIVLEYDEEIEI